MRSVLFNFNFELMLLFTEYIKIVLERFRSSLLHYRYMGGILTVVRACPKTQLDYSNYDKTRKIKALTGVEINIFNLAASRASWI
jgi:hypothetical protein